MIDEFLNEKKKIEKEYEEFYEYLTSLLNCFPEHSNIKNMKVSLRGTSVDNQANLPIIDPTTLFLQYQLVIKTLLFSLLFSFMYQKPKIRV